MVYLVAYVEFLSRTEIRRLGSVFDVESYSAVLPLVSKPFASEADALAKIPELTAGRRLGRGEGDLLIQPEEAHVEPVSVEEALRVIHESDGWLEEVRGRETGLTMQAKECPRCWVILARIADAEIPPGLGFVVDKYSKAVFRRRFIDVVPIVGPVVR